MEQQNSWEYNMQVWTVNGALSHLLHCAKELNEPIIAEMNGVQIVGYPLSNVGDLRAFYDSEVGADQRFVGKNASYTVQKLHRYTDRDIMKLLGLSIKTLTSEQRVLAEKLLIKYGRSLTEQERQNDMDFLLFINSTRRQSHHSSFVHVAAMRLPINAQR